MTDGSSVTIAVGFVLNLKDFNRKNYSKVKKIYKIFSRIKKSKNAQFEFLRFKTYEKTIDQPASGNGYAVLGYAGRRKRK